MLLLDDRGVPRERPANLEVLAFDDALRARDFTPHDRALDWRIRRLRKESRRNQVADPVSHQELIVEAHEEARLARIALPAGASPKLQVDSPALVPIRADHVQAAERHDAVAAQANVGPSTGHVRRDRDRPELAGTRDNGGLLGVVFRVQHLARDTRGAKSRREALRFGHRRRADEHGAAGGMRALNLVDDRALLRLATGEDEVVAIDPYHRDVRRNDDDVEPIELGELGGTTRGGAGHAAEARVAAEKTLQRHRSENAAVRPSRESLLGLEGGLQSVRPVAIRHDPAGELIDDLDAAAPDDVVDVATQEHAGVERAVERREQLDVLGAVKTAATERALDVLDAFLGKLDVAPVFVRVEVDAGYERRDERGEPRRQ